jgi:hypothetical protein
MRKKYVTQVSPPSSPTTDLIVLSVLGPVDKGDDTTTAGDKLLRGTDELLARLAGPRAHLEL